MLLAAGFAGAADRTRIHVPAGDAADTVKSFARQSGAQVFAPNADLEGVETNAVEGEYTPVDALRLMLLDTGLVAERTDADTFTIRRERSHALAAPPPVATEEPPAAREASAAAAPAGARSAAREVEAEPPAAHLEEIVVTGSRIRRAGYDTLEAAIVTDGVQFERRGYTNVIQSLDETPGFVPSGVNPIGRDQGTLNAGQSFADFFGLGSQRTLTLVNSRRFVSSNSVSASGNAAAPGQQVDLNLIPVGLVERVETVAIGGAPIYGSDAIAGTVNIILKDAFEGVQATGQFGVSERGDGRSYTLRALAGTNFADGRGNAVLALEHHDQEGLVLSERTGDRFQFSNPSGEPAASLVTNDLTLTAMTEGGLPLVPGTLDNIVDGGGTPLQFGANGNLVPFVTGDPLHGLIDSGFADGGDGVRLADHRNLLAPTDRSLINVLGHYDLASGPRVFAELALARSEGRELSEVAAFASPALNGTAISVSTGNAFLSPEARDTLAANGIDDRFLLARNFSDLLDRGGLTTNTVEFLRAIGGVEGELTLLGDDARWDLSVNFGRSRGETTGTYIDNERFLAAIDAVRDVTGNVVCASGGDCIPFNLFGVNAFSDAAADYVTDPTRAISLNRQYIVTANLAGTLPFALSADEVDFNVGMEYRKEQGEFRPDELLRAGSSLLGFELASPFMGADGEFDTREVYGELSLPLVTAEQPLHVIDSMSVQAAVRYVDNSIAGGDPVWSLGGRVAPRLPSFLQGVTFRGVYTRSIRAPAVTELFSSASSTRDSIRDPCDASAYDEGRNPAVRAANCTAALAALGVDSPEDFDSTTFATSPTGTLSGNPELENERARSWSAGIVYQPASIRGLRLAADWSRIRLEGGIQSLGIGTLIAACYDSPDFPDTAGCDAFRRLGADEVGPGSDNPARVTGDIANGYDSRFINTSRLDFAGLIVSAEYAFDVGGRLHNATGAGELLLGAKAFHNHRFDFTATPNGPQSSVVGAVGIPKWSGELNATYRRGPLESSLQSLYTGPAKVEPLATSADLPDEDNLVGRYWRFNAMVGVELAGGIRARLVVDNLFDREPSPAALWSGVYGVYDLIGRRYVINLSGDF